MGLVKGLSEKDYFAIDDGLSKSSLTQFLRSPFHYWSVFIRENPPARKETEAFRIGSLIHCAVLEPDRFHKAYRLGDFKDKRSKAWKEFSAQCEEDGVLPMTQKDNDLAENMRDSVHSHHYARAILEKGDAEISAISNDEKTGVQLRSRFDFLPAAGSIIADFKTCQSASPSDFRSSCYKYSYDLQAVFYIQNALLCGLEISEFVFIAVEKEYPYGCGVYILSEKDLCHAKKTFRDGVDRFHAIKEKYGKEPWPSYNTTPQILEINRK